MDLNVLWFILVAVLFAGFFFLEGFDYGVGSLLLFLGRSDRQRREIINAIGPFWDGNEVWLLTAGGATFAAFPHWYATLFSGFYLALVLMLFALIARGVAFEFRSKLEGAAWRRTWDLAIFLGSLVPALLWGVAIGNLLRGVPIDASKNYAGTFLGLLNPYALVGGVTFVLLFAFHGAVFLNLRTDGELRERARRTASALWIPTVVAAVVLLVASYFATDIFTRPLAVVAALLAAVALVGAGLSLHLGREGWSFALTGLTVVSATAMAFLGLFPRLLISSPNPEWSLTIYNASSSPYTLQVMTIVAMIFVPIVLAYQGWTYWVFRRRIRSTQALEY